MTGDCADCRLLLDHCHGTVVFGADGRPECTDLACGDLDPARHDLVVPAAPIAA